LFHDGKQINREKTNKTRNKHKNNKLLGGFNPFEKYKSNWLISPGRGENNKYLKPPSSKGFLYWKTYLKLFLMKIQQLLGEVLQPKKMMPSPTQR